MKPSAYHRLSRAEKMRAISGRPMPPLVLARCHLCPARFPPREREAHKLRCPGSTR